MSLQQADATWYKMGAQNVVQQWLRQTDIPTKLLPVMAMLGPIQREKRTADIGVTMVDGTAANVKQVLVDLRYLNP